MQENFLIIDCLIQHQNFISVNDTNNTNNTDLVEVNGLQSQLSQPLPAVSVWFWGRGYTPHSRFTTSSMLEIHVCFSFFYRTIKSPSTPIYLQGDNIKRLKIKVHMNIYNHQHDIGSATLLSLIHRYGNSDITLSCKYKAKRYVFHVVKELSTISCSDCKWEVFKIINISFISSQCYGSFICLKLF